MKYVLVSGGVISGIGKGVIGQFHFGRTYAIEPYAEHVTGDIASSTGLLLITRGYKVSAIKIDPYMNVDAGTMAPTEHGEVFVLNDGGEVDLDLGNYERYLNITLTKENNITTGKIYQHVIEREVSFEVKFYRSEKGLTAMASYKREREITWERLSRLCHILPMPFKTGLSGSLLYRSMIPTKNRMCA